MDSLLQDARYALRRLAATPGFTAVAVVILAVGLGANTIVFSLVNAVFFPPAPVPDPDRVVGFAWHSRLDPQAVRPLSYPEYRDVAAHADLFESVCASRPVNAPLTIGQETVAGSGRSVTPGCFAVYSFGALRGRLLGPEDLTGAPVAVISEWLWRTRFEAREDVLGTRLRFAQQELAIVGVVRDRPLWADVWLPLTMSRRMGLLPTPDGFETDRTWRGISVMARLKPGVTFEDVDARVPVWTTAFMAEDATLPADHTLRLRRPFEHHPPKEVAGLLALSGVVLLIACANLAGLLLARGMARAKEIAVRLTVGASRMRIVRQFMLENAGLALAGGAAALALTVAFARTLTRLDPPAQWRALAAAQIDWRVFLFVLGLALATALLFGLGPALRASRLDVARSFNGGDAVVTGGNRRLFGMRNVLLMGQFAVSALFVLVSGVFVAGYLNVSTAETGIGRPDAAAVRLDLWISRPDQDEIRGFMERFRRRASETGEPHSVAFVSNLPAGGAMIGGVRSEGPGEGIGRTSGSILAGPGLLDALGIPLLQGREFNEHDRPDTPRVALVSETAARLWWPGQSPIGKGVYLHGFGGWHKVVGVAGNTRVSLTRGLEELVYLHLGQHRSGSLLIVGSAREGSGAAIAAIRRLVHEIDPDTPVGESKSVAQWLEGYVYGQWVYAAGFGSLAALALLLACLGLYGALTFAVAQQTREFGVRMALGADGSAIRRMMLWQGLRVAGLGAAAGLYAAVLGIETIAKITLAVPGRGPLAFTLGPAVLIAVALVASYLPARRASRLDPVETLRTL